MSRATDIGPDKMLPIPLTNAKMEKTIGGRRGSSFDMIVMSLFQTAAKLQSSRKVSNFSDRPVSGYTCTPAYPSAKKPNSKEKMTSTLRFVANPHSRKQLSAEPRQEIVTTARVGHLSLRWPKTSKPTTEEALQIVQSGVSSLSSKDTGNSLHHDDQQSTIAL